MKNREYSQLLLNAFSGQNTLDVAQTYGIGPSGASEV
jgi:hypothetical protein